MIYFYNNSGTSSGPFTKDQLKGKIANDTLVWHEGLTDWTIAAQIDDLKDILNVIPPPLPTQEKIIKIEASIKKEKLEYINENAQSKIASEIKTLFYVAIIATIIGIIGYFIKSDSKYSKLSQELKMYDNERAKNSLGLNGKAWEIAVSTWHNKNREREHMLEESVKNYGCYFSYNFSETAMNITEVLPCLETKSSAVNGNAFSYALKLSLVSLLALAAMRYVFFASKWVAKKSV
ncbi:MAG: DUF4339 domain-containing protein [Chitinophagaceae bacterium]|nr:DUF4339 domain-containing protein [Chitinophagaceae bacterium]